jgi:hypothetical protein
MISFRPFGKSDIEVDDFGLTEEQLSLVAGKIGEAVSIYYAHWHRLA